MQTAGLFRGHRVVIKGSFNTNTELGRKDTARRHREKTAATSQGRVGTDPPLTASEGTNLVDAFMPGFTLLTCDNCRSSHQVGSILLQWLQEIQEYGVTTRGKHGKCSPPVCPSSAAWHMGERPQVLHCPALPDRIKLHRVNTGKIQVHTPSQGVTHTHTLFTVIKLRDLKG